MMTDEEFTAILALDYELPGIEFKGPGLASDKHLFAKVARAVLGMANRRDGGRVIIGVNCSPSVVDRIGLTEPQLRTWNYDDVASKLAEYAEPSISFDLEVKERDGRNYVVLEIQEFEQLPILCKKDYPEVLRKGACYVRSRRKPETTEIPTQEDMRDLLDLAIEKGLRKYVTLAYRAGVGLVPIPTVTAPLPATTIDQELYDKELGDLK